MTRRRIAGALAIVAGLIGTPVAARAAVRTGTDPLDARLPATRTSSGRAIVAFDELPTSVMGADSFAGLPVLRVSDSAENVVLGAPDTGTVRAALRTAGVGHVRYVEDDKVLSTLATPSDARYGEQYGPAMMGFPAAWAQVGYGSPSVIVGIIDSGIRKTHQDLAGSRILQGHDYVNNDADPNDDCGHGTHVSGTIGATTNNGVGVAGMSQASIMMMKGLGAVGGLLSVQCTGNTSVIADAIRGAADQGAKIISMSIGGGGTTTLQSAVDYAWNKGVILVAAAGNDGAPNSIDYPAAYDNVIAVAALDSTKARASYSDGGPQLDIAAPGTDVLSSYNTNDTTYSLLSGTSMATPHVAGALALALSCAPQTTNLQLRNALLSTAEDLGAPGRDDSFGYGLARADRLVASLCTGGGTTTTTAPSTTTSTSGATTTSIATTTTSAATTTTGAATTTTTRATTTTTQPTTTTTAPADPDPSTPNLANGQQVSAAVPAAGDVYYKIKVPAGATQLQVVMTGPACGLLACSFDADLSTRLSARPTDTVYACRPYLSGSNETCTQASPTVGYWYVRVNAYTGSGTVALKATVS